MGTFTLVKYTQKRILRRCMHKKCTIYAASCLFRVRIGASADLEPVCSTVVYIAVNISLVAFCAASIIPQYMTLFVLDQFCHLPGVYVPITV